MTDKTVIIGITGPSASGKSLLAQKLLHQMGNREVVVISEDSYYKDLTHIPMSARNEVNFDHPDALDHDYMIKQLTQLQAGEGINVPIYDYSKHARSKETRYIEPHRIIILEGILLFVEKSLREKMDIRIFMDTALDICLLRRLKRDIIERDRSIESVMRQYENTVRPMYLQFTEPAKRYADIIVPRGGQNEIATDMIQAKMRELLKDNQLLKK